jgi:mannose-1-phosphate guanylyltransferase
MRERRLWAIVLAGGEGSRLAETTERVYGSRLPKQFLSFGLERTFLQATVDRLQALIPPERTVVIVPAPYLELARDQLRSLPGIELVAQPRNLGTGPGVLLPLSHVLKRDPRADVALVPSDHDFRAPAIMLQALVRAKRATAAYKSSMVLLGASAEGPASDLGWIVTRKVRRSDAVPSIQEFVEKPAPSVANSLFQRGALWNTMLSVSRAEALWALARRHLPEHTALFEEYAQLVGSSAAQACLSQLYERLAPADFSRDLVAASTGLRATTMAGAGWSDCGTPERLAAALAQGPALVKVSGAAFRRAPQTKTVTSVPR